MTFGEKLRYLRTKKELSQADLAQRIGVSLRTITGWETENRYPKKRDLYTSLANELGCEVDYLLSEKESFITDASGQYGSRGLKDADEIIESVNALFASGSIDEEDMDSMMLALHEAYMEAKRRNKKYTPKKYHSSENEE